MAKPKLTEDEKLQRQWERKAQKINAERVDEMPLFAEQVDLVTTEEMRRLWLRQKSLAGQGVSEFKGDKLLRQFALGRMRWFAAKFIDAETLAKLEEYRVRTYPPDHGYEFWQDVLTGGRKIVYACHGEPDPTKTFGFRYVEDAVWPPPGWTPPLTKEQFYEMWPYDKPELKQYQDFRGAVDPWNLMRK